ncbi:hypothetical protein B0T19DRAFT_442967 [Cercophora scortea]|uniref:Uncharacterized protein n=1 Tax=Cercophora scortea TaxID=314031 RepID=A0AAE0IFT0_9PEZI|nr:hypothetical protein B0T19DRAFT_442967 [Cercophora scortea]
MGEPKVFMTGHGVDGAEAEADVAREPGQRRHEGNDYFAIDGLMSAMPSSRSTKDLSPKSAPRAPVLSLDPPRPAKEGFEWVWFPEGYWAEREFRPSNKRNSHGSSNVHNTGGKSPDTKGFKWRRRSAKSQRSSGGRSAGGGSHDDMEPMTISPRSLAQVQELISPAPHSPQSPYLSEEAHVQSLQHPTTSVANCPRAKESEWLGPKPKLETFLTHAPKLPAPVAPVETKPIVTFRPRYHLPYLPWKGRGFSFQKSKDKDKHGEAGHRQLPDEAVDAIEGYLTKFPASHGDQTAAKTEVEGGLKRVRSRLRKFSRQTTGTHQRTTSDPVSTAPETAPEKKAAENSTFTTPQMWLSQFPGGEAGRVFTPPLKEDTADGKPRGLFFDVNGPSEHGGSASSTASTRGTRNTASSARKGEREREREAKKAREWWDTPPSSLVAVAVAAASKREFKEGKAALFEFDVPEHLPSSPMCPANPKHSSKGKGVCVYHGRRKSIVPQHSRSNEDMAIGFPGVATVGYLMGLSGRNDDVKKSF